MWTARATVCERRKSPTVPCASAVDERHGQSPGSRAPATDKSPSTSFQSNSRSPPPSLCEAKSETRIRLRTLRTNPYNWMHKTLRKSSTLHSWMKSTKARSRRFVLVPRGRRPTPPGCHCSFSQTSGRKADHLASHQARRQTRPHQKVMKKTLTWARSNAKETILGCKALSFDTLLRRGESCLPERGEKSGSNMW